MTPTHDDSTLHHHDDSTLHHHDDSALHHHEPKSATAVIFGDSMSNVKSGMACPHVTRYAAVILRFECRDILK